MTKEVTSKSQNLGTLNNVKLIKTLEIKSKLLHANVYIILNLFLLYKYSLHCFDYDTEACNYQTDLK